MIDSKHLDDLATRLNQLAPPQLQAVKKDFQDNLRAVVSGWLERLDLVTREEFDAQKAVLASTREKLETLQQRVHQLEQRQQTSTLK